MVEFFYDKEVAIINDQTVSGLKHVQLSERYFITTIHTCAKSFSFFFHPGLVVGCFLFLFLAHIKKAIT